ncbi:MAG TPA: PAS domain S-box protein [Marmoricola sp.]|nr:PAS domain S-box protein [Marmoricola sp.]HNJ77975.1 PAS domain S-box protein [Marmoricola sp.]
MTEHDRTEGTSGAGASIFRDLLEFAPDGLVIVNAQGRIVLVNAMAERMFGYQRSDLLGEPVEVLLPDRLAGMHSAFRAGYQANPEPRAVGQRNPLWGRRQDGAEFPVEISLSPLQTDDGLVVSAYIRDVTDRLTAQAEADRVKEEFFATVSHELRTPLTSMIGYGELMQDLETLSEQGERFLSIILRSAERELRLVEDLLTLVSTEGAELAINPSRIDLVSVVRDAVGLIEPRCEEQGLSLSLELPNTPVMILGDVDRLGQALGTLLANAVKFSRPESSLQVQLRIAGSQAHIDVIDHAPTVAGTSPGQSFDTQEDAGATYEHRIRGVGIGLTITLAIMDAHKGSIEVLSDDEDSSVFRVILPLS